MNLWERIQRLRPNILTENATAINMPLSSDSASEPSSDFDDVMTELFGGSLSPNESSNTSRFMKQLKALDVEERHSHNYDVWNHWIARKLTHPELYEVAMVVLATPSSQASVERAFSALALILTDTRTGLGEKTLSNILTIKLNRELFQKVLPGLYDWKALETEETESLLDTSS